MALVVTETVRRGLQHRFGPAAIDQAELFLSWNPEVGHAGEMKHTIDPFHGFPQT